MVEVAEGDGVNMYSWRSRQQFGKGREGWIYNGESMMLWTMVTTRRRMEKEKKKKNVDETVGKVVK